MSLPDCDCLNECCDDKRVAAGEARPCDMERARRARQAELLAQEQRAALQLERAVKIADEAAIELIESEGWPTTRQDVRWYDITPLRNVHEFSAELIDLHNARLAHAEDRGLIALHPEIPGLVRITRQP